LGFQVNLMAQYNDVSLEKTVDKSVAALGDTVTFSLTITNEGGLDQTGLQVTDLLPTGATHISNSPPGTTTYDPSTGIWDIDDELTAAAGNMTLTIKATMDTTGVVYNEAEVTANDSTDVDSNPMDGNPYDDDYATACVSVPKYICGTQGDQVTLTAESGQTGYQWFKDAIAIPGETNPTLVVDEEGDYTYTVDATCPTESCCPIKVIESCIDLALKKELNPLTVQPSNVGDKIQFLITVYNQGTDDVYEVLIKDYIPTGLAYILSDNSALTTGNQNDWSADSTYLIDYLAAGDSTVVKLWFEIDPSFPSTNYVINQAEIIFMTNSNGGTANVPDLDSEADDDVSNDIVGPDNVVDNSGGDEDDHDFAVVFNERLVDPNGLIYCDKTGDLVTGGTVSVSGPGTVFIIEDGTNGTYQFFTDGTAGIYTISYLHPASIPLSPNCLPEGGSIDPTLLDDGTGYDTGVSGDGFVTLGLDTLATGEIADTTCGFNPYFLSFDLAAGDPFVEFNNLPVQCIFIGAIVCEDTDGDEVADDPDDGSLSGATVNLYTCSGSTPIATTVTNSLGEYEFTGLTPGAYKLQFLTPDGYRANAATVGNLDVDGFAPCVTLDYGDCDTTVYVCYILDQFDLALTKQETSSGPYMPGSTVTYNIAVTNQGTQEAFDVQVADYIPTGMTLNDATWVMNNTGTPYATLLAPIASISVGGSVNVPITLTIDNNFQGASLINYAEIAFATNEDGSGVNTPDSDSNADTSNNDFVGADNEVNNNGGDEDDHDPAEIMVGQIFDLALINTLSGSTPGPFTPGSTVTFDMTVTNQGTIDAYDVEVTNYIPNGLTLADSDWTVVGGNAVLLNEINHIPSGDDAVVSITYIIDPNYQADSIRNWAEISFATDTDGSGLNTTDVDSDADDTQFGPGGQETDDLVDDNINTGDAKDGVTPTDEDDHDPVQIAIEQTFDLALSQAYASFVDNDGDGMISAGDDVVFNITVYNHQI